MGLSILLFSAVAPNAVAASGDCGKNRTFFGLPTWYKYLEFQGQNCEIKLKDKLVTYDKDGKVVGVNESIDFKSIWLILFAVVELLLMLAGFLAFIFVLMGGYKYVLSQGNPEKISNALQTIKNALIGVIIAIVASQIVAYVAGRLSS